MAQEKYSLSLMQYNSIISAIPSSFKQDLHNQHYSQEQSKYQELLTVNNPVQMCYRRMVTDENIMTAKHKKWEIVLNKQIPYQQFVNSIYQIWQISNITKLRSFQYKLLQWAIITNIHLFKWKIITSPSCYFCQKQPESYEHLFVTCEFVQPIWEKLEEWMCTFSDEAIHFQTDMVLWSRLVDKLVGHIKNFLCLVTKQYIYQQRCLKKELCFHELRKYILQLRNIEKYYAMKNNNLHKHVKKWGEKEYEPLII